jgi:hypothetical protein
VGLDVRQMFHAARTLLREGVAQIRHVGDFDLVAPAENNVPMAVTRMTFSAFQNRRLNPILKGMAEHAFELAGGVTVKIVGDLIKERTETSDFLPRHGPKTEIKIYKTEKNGFLATIKYHPDVANQKKGGDEWTGFVPDRHRPKIWAINELRSEFESDLILRKFENVIIEAHVKRAINELFPPSGPTVID